MITALMFLSLFCAPSQTMTAQQTSASAPAAATRQAVAPAQSSGSYRISGVIVDSVTGTPVSRAEVSIVDTSGDGEGETIRTTDGTFVFDGVAPGKKYRLSATAPGYVAESYNQHQGFFSSIAVGDGFDSEHLVFRLQPRSVIYGTVTDEHGEPVRHAQVMLLRFPRTASGPNIGANASTNDLGEYRFSRLTAGKYVILVQASPWYAQSGFKFAAQLSDGPVVLGDGTSVSISTGFSVSTDRIMIGGAPKSDPILDVVYPITFYPSATDPNAAEQLQIAPGEKREADIALTAVPSVHFRVTNIPIPANSSPDSSAPPPNFQVTQSVFGMPMGWGPQYTQIAPGEYELSGLPPGNATININEFGPDHQTQILQANLSAGTIDASTGASAANVSGQVIFPAGAPPSIQGAVFLANAQGGNFPARLHKDGTFSFEGAQLLPGNYSVSISMNNGRGENYVQQVSASGAKVSGRDITIESGEPVQLTLTVGRGLGQISGVAQLDGKPASGAMVLLIPESRQDIEEDYREDQTDTDGSFALGRIIPGKYLLMAIQNGWDLDWRDPQVLAPYRERAQQLEIAPGQNLKVTVAAQSTSSTSVPPVAPSSH